MLQYRNVTCVYGRNISFYVNQKCQHSTKFLAEKCHHLISHSILIVVPWLLLTWSWWYMYILWYLCFARHQGFEGSIVAENFSSSDPSSNNPMMHGGLDNGGGLISFHRVRENFCCACVFSSTVIVQRAKHSGSKSHTKKNRFTIVDCNIPRHCAFCYQKFYLSFEYQNDKSSDVAVLS